MSCEQFSALLDAMESRALTAEQRAAMDEHARECADCALLLALRTLDEDIAIPDTCGYGWRRAVRKESKRTRGPRRAFRALCAAAAVVVFLCGGTLLTRGMGWNTQNKTTVTDNGTPFTASRSSDFVIESNESSSYDAEGVSGASQSLSDHAEVPALEATPAHTTFFDDMGVFLSLSAPYLAALAALAAITILLRRVKARRATQHKEEEP